MSDYLIRGTLAELDPAVHQLTQLEAERQYRKIILIASESSAPHAAMEATTSAFTNIYAEGYPDEETRQMSEDEILDYGPRLAHYRRYSDPRYYKGVEYADAIEALARRRCAELFATAQVPAEKIFVNVQALSGAPANNAVYNALLKPGETVMGLDLVQGGHLSHGAKANRSGAYYNSVPYGLDPATERLDYSAVRALAMQHRPKLLIAGYSSYPWVPDWAEFRRIADECGAVLLADIAHIAGLVAAGEAASPLGHAHVISFTTHKSLCGPRGACLLTTDAALARKLDRAVFPGEQGGPHINTIAGLAVVFKLNQRPQFKALQKQIRANAVRFAQQLQAHGFRVPFGGTEIHLFNLDCKSVVGAAGAPLMGEMAARILDLAGVVVNRNTIPGDRGAFYPSGLRLATPWITQRGFMEKEVDELAGHMAAVLRACVPFAYAAGRGKPLHRTRVDFKILNESKNALRDLAQRMGIDYQASVHGYPHFYYSDSAAPAAPFTTIVISGAHAAHFLELALASDVGALPAKGAQATSVARLEHGAFVTVAGTLARAAAAGSFELVVPSADANTVAAWLRDVSDGYVSIDAADVQGKLPGPVQVQVTGGVQQLPAATPAAGLGHKPYYIGHAATAAQGTALPDFVWNEPSAAALQRTALHAQHVALGGRLAAFAGWEMPLWYSSVVEEHAAVRNAAGLFDVAHMGVWDASGPAAAGFLDQLVGNDVRALGVGESLYTHLLTPAADVLDDLLIYRLQVERFLVVVNAGNDSKDWAWVTTVQAGTVRVDAQRPAARVAGGAAVQLRDLRAAGSAAEQRVDLALQGPSSQPTLLALGGAAADVARVRALKRTQLCSATLGGFDLIVSRTGYSGELLGYELFVHPARAEALWLALLAAGAPLGVKPCGLAARDSLRTEAGLPLYGHEFAGALALGVGESGFGAYIKLHKPWFIGRAAFKQREAVRTREVLRFRFAEKGVRMAHPGDPVVDKRGRVAGTVTSCALDSDGFLTGQAVVELALTEPGTAVGIFAGGGEKPDLRAKLQLGERVPLCSWAVVQPRMWRKQPAQ